jgi:carboxylesterase type B
MDARINGNRQACIQSDGSGAEDCLYLDIVKPDSIAPNTLLPIYFWIHGGHFRNGAGAWYTGMPLGDTEEMIVVTVQYRLGPLGFLNYPRHMGSEVPLNIGLFDQRMALKLIYDYAETIGGDKNRITVSGESAGGISTSMHAFAPPSAMYIAQTIQQSGAAALSGPADYTNANMEQLLQYLCTFEISCPAWVSVSQTIQYLRSLEFGTDDFWKMYFTLGTSGAGLVNDDRDFFGGQTLSEIIDAKSFKIMPTIIFFTAFEGSLSVGDYPTKYNKDNYMNVWTDNGHGSLLHSYNDLTYEDKQLLTWRSFGRMSCDFPDETPARFEDIDDTTAVRITLDIYGDMMFRGPGIRAANEYHEQGADTWIIHFDETEGGSEWSKELVFKFIKYSEKH